MAEQTLVAPEPVGVVQKPASTRSLLVDVVRGLAISLVAFGHTNQGLIHYGWWDASDVGGQIDRFIYSFHMPAFFFVSGVFLLASVNKRGPVKFIHTKIGQMMYPFLLWSILQWLAGFPLQRFMRTPNPGPKAWLLHLLNGDTLWFMPAIFLCVLLGMLLRKVSMPLLFALAVAVSLLPVTWPLNFLTTTFQHFPFLVAGMWVGRECERIEQISLPVAAFGAVALGGLVFLVSHGPLLENPFTAVPVGLLGTAMLFLIARCFRKDSFARSLAWVGEASFGVYLMAGYGQGFGREVLHRALHTTEPYVQLVLPSLLGIFVSAWIFQHRVRLRLAWLFQWPL